MKIEDKGDEGKDANPKETERRRECERDKGGEEKKSSARLIKPHTEGMKRRIKRGVYDDRETYGCRPAIGSSHDGNRGLSAAAMRSWRSQARASGGGHAFPSSATARLQFSSNR